MGLLPQTASLERGAKGRPGTGLASGKEAEPRVTYAWAHTSASKCEGVQGSLGDTCMPGGLLPSAHTCVARAATVHKLGLALGSAPPLYPRAPLPGPPWCAKP